MDLSTPVEQLPKVGPQYQKKLKKLGIKTVQQILFHFPHRYEDFSNIVPIAKVKAKETVCIKGKILEIENTRAWIRKMVLTQAIVQDSSGAIKVIWFNQPYLTNTLRKGDFICLAGKISEKQGKIYLSSPAFEKISMINDKLSMINFTHTGRLVPVYPETEGLSSRWLRFIIKMCLNELKNKLQDPLPKEIKQEHGLLNLEKAVWQIHFPDSLKLAKQAQKRFSFENLFYLSLWILRKKQKLAKEKAVGIPLNLELVQKFIKQLPFKLTDSQKKSTWQILKDLEKSRPMNRLLDGDVGSGKTVVATMAILNTIKAGFQTALMVPTEILAQQHFQEISKLLKGFNVKIGLLTGKKKLKEKNAELLIGTHALIQKTVKFKNLALVIVDEQHKFGVEQRAKLATRKTDAEIIPHLLSMTATPIPRTLTLTLYGDLDLSLIDELPKERKKIITKVVGPKKHQQAYDFIRQQVKKSRQVFVVCPRIEPNEKQETTNWADVKAVKEEYEKLSKDIFPDLKVGMLHGKMKSKEKEQITKKFKQGKIDILVSTSVIEVGVDVPNASVMLIEGAERFGLAQLHQFRGRVGRSKHQSFCFLFTESKAVKTKQRLKALTLSEDGFALAEKDLEIRGPGSFIGSKQWGIPDLIMSNLKDVFLIETTRKAAKKFLEKDPQLKKYPLVQEKLKEFQQQIHLE